MQKMKSAEPRRRGKTQHQRPGVSFERQVAHLFRHLGYRVHKRPATHDLGVDLVVTRHGHKAIVQCKNWRHPVGPAAVRDLYGTLLHTGADLGILVTSSTVSKSAQRFAAGKPLLLMDGPILELLQDGL
jgi:restriction system protein